MNKRVDQRKMAARQTDAMPKPIMQKGAPGIARQRGFGVGCFFLLVGMIVVAVIVGAKLVPVYIDDAAIVEALERTSEKRGIRSMPQRQIVRVLKRELYNDDIGRIPFDKALTTRSVNGKRELRLTYEVAIPLAKNISLLLDFDHYQLSK